MESPFTRLDASHTNYTKFFTSTLLNKYSELLVEYNPLTQIMEGFRYMLLDIGEFNLVRFLYTLGISLFIFLMGLVIFNRTEKSFIDTV